MKFSEKIMIMIDNTLNDPDVMFDKTLEKVKNTLPNINDGIVSNRIITELQKFI